MTRAAVVLAAAALVGVCVLSRWLSDVQDQLDRGRGLVR